MKIEIRPKDNVLVIKNMDSDMVEIYCQDESENGFLIIISKDKAKTLANDILRHPGIKENK